jgi:hypothetical protein
MPLGILLGSLVVFLLIFIAATTYFLRVTEDQQPSPGLQPPSS